MGPEIDEPESIPGIEEPGEAAPGPGPPAPGPDEPVSGELGEVPEDGEEEPGEATPLAAGPGSTPGAGPGTTPPVAPGIGVMSVAVTGLPPGPHDGQTATVCVRPGPTPPDVA